MPARMVVRYSNIAGLFSYHFAGGAMRSTFENCGLRGRESGIDSQGDEDPGLHLLVKKVSSDGRE